MNDDIVQRAESMLETRLPPGTLELAVNDPAIWTQLEVAAQLCDFVPELVAEIKRLRSTYYEKKFLEAVAAKDSLNTDLMANCNQLRDRCWKAESKLARWQQIAINELARSMYNEAMIDREYDLPDGINGFKDQAAKELNLQVTREAGYVDRLEKDFLDQAAARIYYESISDISDYWSWHDYPEEPCQMRLKQRFRDRAQAALAAIREGKP